MASPAQAHDVNFSLITARKALPELSKRFVVMGHSQGGGAAWAFAQQQVLDQTEGYIGAVTVIPTTRILKEGQPFRSILIAAMWPGMVARATKFYETP